MRYLGHKVIRHSWYVDEAADNIPHLFINVEDAILIAKDKARIKWSCRRGMLELDVIIMPFFDVCFDQLTPIEQQDFVDLLECDDPDLFCWLMGKGASDEPKLAAMINKIVEHNRSKLR